MKLRPIQQKDVPKILSSDEDIYPVSLSSSTFETWLLKSNRYNEFGMMYVNNDDEIVACCIVIPLNMYGFMKLINGELKEKDISDEHLFSTETETNKVGLHFYHIEKYDKYCCKKFHEVALRDLSNVLKHVEQKRKSKLQVIGCSALAVSKEGIHLFYNVLNFKELGSSYCNEHLLTKNGKVHIVKTTKNGEIEEYLEKGFTYLNRCKLLVSFPGEISKVWTFLKPNDLYLKFV